jgi:hypothetical protein
MAIRWLFLGSLLALVGCGHNETKSGQGPPSSIYVPPGHLTPMNEIVQTVVLPQLDSFIQQVVTLRASLTLDGVNPFTSSDQFLPGKLAIGFADLLLSIPPSDARFASYLANYRDVAHWVLSSMPMDGGPKPLFVNHTWGMYYYMNAIARLNAAGLLHPGDPTMDDKSAIAAADLDILKVQLDWRSTDTNGMPTPNGFVNTTDWTLVGGLPTNYYGVAFGIARNRVKMSWEDNSGADAIFLALQNHFDTESGYGYSDETAGEGRFDRYSLLVMGEISQRLIETGVTVPDTLKTWLRNSVDGQLHLLNVSGNGFEYGRSLGPYADTSFLEVLSAAAFLGVLTQNEKDLAYAFCTRVLAKYIAFWFDSDMHSVNMWKKGRRTDAYRAENRILGENLSLIHQLLYTTDIWNRAGYKDAAPMSDADFQARLDALDKQYVLTFATPGKGMRPAAYAVYDRKTIIVRDGSRVISLPLISGGTSQYANNPYYPIPQSTAMIDGTPDATWPQLLPEFHMSDMANSVLKPVTYFKNIATTGNSDSYTVSYHQDELANLVGDVTKVPPMPDTRLALDASYTFSPGAIACTEKFTPASASVSVTSVTMQFGTYSKGPTIDGTNVTFADGVVQGIDVNGLGTPTVDDVSANTGYNTPNGALNTRVTWQLANPSLAAPLVITWTLRYDPH